MKKLLLSAFLTLCTFVSAMAQCPMCKASVESARKGTQKSVGMGLNPGILFMLGTVYVVVGAIAFMWYKKYRQSRLSIS